MKKLIALLLAAMMLCGCAALAEEATTAGTIKTSDRVKRGTLVTEGVWWQCYTKDGNTNRLTSMRLTDKDGGSTFYDVSVTIEKG